jgi:hypothetical protein
MGHIGITQAHPKISVNPYNKNAYQILKAKSLFFSEHSALRVQGRYYHDQNKIKIFDRLKNKIQYLCLLRHSVEQSLIAFRFFLLTQKKREKGEN